MEDAARAAVEVLSSVHWAAIGWPGATVLIGWGVLVTVFTYRRVAEKVVDVVDRGLERLCHHLEEREQRRDKAA